MRKQKMIARSLIIRNICSLTDFPHTGQRCLILTVTTKSEISWRSRISWRSNFQKCLIKKTKRRMIINKWLSIMIQMEHWNSSIKKTLIPLITQLDKKLVYTTISKQAQTRLSLALQIWMSLTQDRWNHSCNSNSCQIWRSLTLTVNWES
jgi:hypothetical protein